MDTLPSTRRCALLALVYGAVLFYASTVVSPTGFTFKPAAPADQWLRFINILSAGFVQNGSDQRADWIANLAALIPLGALVALALRARQPSAPGALVSGGTALLICLTYVVTVKYVQLWFPRTVSLNYVTAQSIGAAAGVCCGVFGRTTMDSAIRRLARGTPEGLLVLAVLASGAVALLTLSPYDIVLSRDDLMARLAALPQFLAAFPGGGRPAWLRLALYAAGGLLYAPAGVAAGLLARRPGWRGRIASLVLGQIAFVGAVWCASLLLLTGAPSVWTLLSRTLGCLLGMGLVRAITPGRLLLLCRVLGSPAMWLPYLFALLAVNNLLSTHWRGLAETWHGLDGRQFLPLWTFYIVSKAQASLSLAVHVVMFAPIGLFLWASAPATRGGAARRGAARIGLGRQCATAALAFCLALAIELGRALRPNLLPDFNNGPIAAAAAWATLMAMPPVWAMLCDVARPDPRP